EFAGKPINYKVTHPGGAEVRYVMKTRRHYRKSLRSHSCSISSQVAQREVNDLEPSQAVPTAWCYEPYRHGDTNTQWVYMYGPTSFEAFEFKREVDNEGEDWAEGVLLKHRIFEPSSSPAACADNMGDPVDSPSGLTPLRSTLYEYEKRPTPFFVQHK